MAEYNVTCLQDIEDIALKTLPRNALDYYRSGANHMSTLRENQAAFQKSESNEAGSCNNSQQIEINCVWGKF